MSLRNMALAGVACLSLLLGTGCEKTAAPVKKVASIDEAAVYKMDMFVNAEKELETWAKTELEKRAKEVEGKTDEEKAEALKLFQAEAEKKRLETLTPLKDKARAAVANAAKKQGATVVLDKRIVVYGVPDITESVTGMLKSGGEMNMPEGNPEEEAKSAPIGYFDQNIVSNLKVFKEAQVEMFQERAKLMKSLEEELKKMEDSGKKPSPAEMQALQTAMTARLQALREQKLTPLQLAVTKAVEEVAKKEGLSLVLDTQHVMYGGRNLTEEVVDTFIKNVAKGAEAPANPVPEETPAAPAEGG